MARIVGLKLCIGVWDREVYRKTTPGWRRVARRDIFAINGLSVCRRAQKTRLRTTAAAKRNAVMDESLEIKNSGIAV